MAKYEDRKPRDGQNMIPMATLKALRETMEQHRAVRVNSSGPGSNKDPFGKYYRDNSFKRPAIVIKRFVEEVLKSNPQAINELNENRDRLFKHLYAFNNVSVMTVMLFLFLEVPAFRADIRAIQNGETSERINSKALSDRVWEYQHRMSLLLRPNYATAADANIDFDKKELEIFDFLLKSHDHFRSAFIETQGFALEIYKECSVIQDVDVDLIKNIHNTLEKLCVRVYYVVSEFIEVARPTEPKDITTEDNPDTPFPKPPPDEITAQFETVRKLAVENDALDDFQALMTKTLDKFQKKIDPSSDNQKKPAQKRNQVNPNLNFDPVLKKQILDAIGSEPRREWIESAIENYIDNSANFSPTLPPPVKGAKSFSSLISPEIYDRAVVAAKKANMKPAIWIRAVLYNHAKTHLDSKIDNDLDISL